MARNGIEGGIGWKEFEARPKRQFPVDNVIDLLEANGFSSGDSVDGVLKDWGDDDVERLAADVFDFLDQSSPWESNTLTTSSLLTACAGASVRGDAGCIRYECRARKLEILGAYAGLYADRVFLPVRLNHPDANESPSVRRAALSAVLSTLLHLGKLVRAGFVQAVTTGHHYCSECASKALLEYKEGHNAARAQAEAHLADFKFVFSELEVLGTTVSTLSIRGPKEYLEHWSLMHVYYERPVWAPAQTSKERPFIVPTDIVRRYGLVERIFASISRDIVFNQAYLRKFNAAYLTDLPGEAEFFNILNHDQSEWVRTTALCAYLTHELPIFAGLPIGDIVEIRNEIPEAFEAYRTKLTAVARTFASKHETITPSDARQIYEDELRPAVARLSLEASNERKKRIRKSLVFGGVLTAAVSLGAAGIITSAQLFGAATGAAGVKLLDSLTESRATSSVANDSFYFLLQLDERRRKKSKH